MDEQKQTWSCPACRDNKTKEEELQKKYDELEQRYKALMGCYQLSVAAGVGLRRVVVTAWHLLGGSGDDPDQAVRDVLAVAGQEEVRSRDCEPEGDPYDDVDLAKWPADVS